ncbi:MAG TPA: hypothetical protein VM864_00580, partial [Pyrinomonadaceae bacterium]|nr:hypothetical protein [Pyrinomonadaceae bacterium]
MIPAIVVFVYLAVVLYIGVFAFRKARGKEEAEDYFLASRSLGPVVFLLSLFGTNMTAFAILGSSGHAFSNGIVTFGLMATSSGLVIPLTLFLIGTRVWALGKKFGFMTPVQMFRDRWECGHIGTVITVVQAALLVPYIIIGVMGGGTTLNVISGGLVPFWLGGAVVALVVMSYVFFGGMRGTAWVNTFQTVLFLIFGAIAVVVIGSAMGGFAGAIGAMQNAPALAPLLTRERVSPYYFFSYPFIPLSAIAFPHIAIFCLTARKMSQIKKTVISGVQAALLLPYIIIGVMGGGTTLNVISGGVVPFWFGGAIVAMVVMSYVFFGGMRGTAWVNSFQTILFLVFGAIALVVIGAGMGGFKTAVNGLLSSPATAPLLTRERISPYYFFSYTFIPLSAIAFPHIAIFCLTARKMGQFKKTVIFYPLCIMAIWLPCVFLGVMANRVQDVPQIRAKVEARRALATQGKNLPPEQRDQLREQSAGD